MQMQNGWTDGCFSCYPLELTHWNKPTEFAPIKEICSRLRLLINRATPLPLRVRLFAQLMFCSSISGLKLTPINCRVCHIEIDVYLGATTNGWMDAAHV